MGTDFYTLAAGDGTTPAGTTGGTVTLAMPVICIILAAVLLANGKAPRLAGFLLFIAGVGLSGTQFAGSLSTSTHAMFTSIVDGFTNALS
ncbi:hypothetical protein [Yinghuangia seranimata]|uniref:hypothetical protein n=1 Tax=Yinghuangia seranimata TaxID=408067 RepID=UPI00248B6464|nr:hypothetical protein [Yinghuangia seranimata]MDI2126947.1 hypothetical protein [Yinghuangia seranimata]